MAEDMSGDREGEILNWLGRKLSVIVVALCVSWLWFGTVQARVKTPFDVYAYGMVLKQEVAYLREQLGILSSSAGADAQVPASRDSKGIGDFK